jgi:hypothetical protein
MIYSVSNISNCVINTINIIYRCQNIIDFIKGDIKYAAYKPWALRAPHEDFFEHTGLSFRTAAYSRYDVTSEMF